MMITGKQISSSQFNLDSQSLGRLHTLDAVVRAGSITNAAIELGVTKSAVSQRVNKLESSLGLVIFERVNRALILTKEGAHLHKIFQHSLRELNRDISKIIHTHDKTDFTMVCSPKFCSQYFKKIVFNFMKLNPDIGLNLVIEHNNESTVEHQIGVCSFSDLPIGVQHFPIFKDEFITVCTPDYAKENDIYQKSRSLDSLCLIYDENTGQANEEDNLWDLLYQGQTQCKPMHCQHVHLAGTELTLDCVLSDIGIGVMPLNSVQEHLNAGLLVEAFPYAPKLPIGNFHLYWNNIPMSSELEHLVEYFLQQHEHYNY
ncbi:LysR family transcriptional regulator [Vibrio sp.]|nr:LysR family transcriptional regulator [Vibrio sp.]